MDPIQPLVSAAAGATSAAGTAVSKSPAGADFVKALGDALRQADGLQAKADALARAYQLGEGNVSLESSMVALQEANVSLQFLVQVRNKLVNAYHDVMNMPI